MYFLLYRVCLISVKSTVTDVAYLYVLCSIISPSNNDEGKLKALKEPWIPPDTFLLTVIGLRNTHDRCIQTSCSEHFAKYAFYLEKRRANVVGVYKSGRS